MKKLIDLLSVLNLPLDPEYNCDIFKICQHSALVEPGTLFLAKPGSKVSGAQYIEQAIAKGAAAIVTSEDVAQSFKIPVFKVPDILKAETLLAAKFYDYPSKKLCVLGVTGTNGKTTFTYLMQSIAKQAQLKMGIVGTINYQIPQQSGQEIDILNAPNTTPTAIDLQKILHELVQRKVPLASLEVSSHALSLGRADDVEFDGAIFTNLTQDHLDFHQTMENYFTAKSKLFKQLLAKKSKGNIQPFSIINMDDEYGKRLCKLSNAKVFTYSIKNRSDYKASNIQLSDQGIVFVLAAESNQIQITSRLVGLHNVYNILSAIACARQLGIDWKVIEQGIQNADCIPGRMQVVSANNRKKVSVIVDYAHTEDALINALKAVKTFAQKRVITVFGCGGDRDRAKRPLMGKAAATLSDWTILTCDNPRSEDPDKILLDIEVGIRSLHKNNYEILKDREKAIFKAIEIAQEGDVVLIAGKGHETYQIYKNETLHFDDREIAAKALQ